MIPTPSPTSHCHKTEKAHQHRLLATLAQQLFETTMPTSPTQLHLQVSAQLFDNHLLMLFLPNQSYHQLLPMPTPTTRPQFIMKCQFYYQLPKLQHRKRPGKQYENRLFMIVDDIFDATSHQRPPRSVTGLCLVHSRLKPSRLQKHLWTQLRLHGRSMQKPCTAVQGN